MKQVIFFLTLLLTHLSTLCASIEAVDSFVLLKQKLEALDLTSQDLVLFDVDETLIMPRDAILRKCARPLAKKMLNEYRGCNSFDTLRSIILQDRKAIVVDPKTRTLVHQLQTEKIPVLAFTSMPWGTYGQIGSLADWRIAELQSMGFNFTLTTPYKRCICFMDWPYSPPPPYFQAGVLFAAEQPKGEVLQAFLSEIPWTPKRIIFVDNSLYKVESVQKTLKELGMPFYGFHLTKVANMECVISKPLARYQLEYLAQHGRWLSDEEAQELRRAGCCP